MTGLGGKAKSGNLSLRHGWAIFLSLGTQVIAVTFVDDLHFGLAKLLLAAGYMALIAALMVNVRRPGMAVVALGAIMNFTAIIANGGAMPLAADSLSPDSQRLASEASSSGFISGSKDVIKSAESVKLKYLADRFVLSSPIKLVYSPGDVLIASGILLYVVALLLRSTRLAGHLAIP